MDRMPAGWAPLSSCGIQFESILILPALVILRFPRFERFWIYTNPTYPIYRILSSSIWRGIRWVILILPALCILPCPRSYRIGVYPNPTGVRNDSSELDTAGYPQGEVSYGRYTRWRSLFLSYQF